VEEVDVGVAKASTGERGLTILEVGEGGAWFLLGGRRIGGG
jgi:hypothetical protein